MPVRFFLELKSFEQDTLLDRIDPSVRTFSVGIMSLQKRANRLVRDAAEQLLPYADSGHPMIIVLDNYCQKGISLYNPDAAVPLPRDVFNDPDAEHLN